jgi:hypothetical protein
MISCKNSRFLPLKELGSLFGVVYWSSMEFKEQKADSDAQASIFTP